MRETKGEFMNPLNYASLEASKKLADNGIVLETDFVWRLGADGWKLLTKDWVRDMMSNTYESLPAPSMTEVWRELPEWTECKKQAVETKCVLMTKDNIKVFFSENPTDALIDLLIYIKDLKRSD